MYIYIYIYTISVVIYLFIWYYLLFVCIYIYIYTHILHHLFMYHHCHFHDIMLCHGVVYYDFVLSLLLSYIALRLCIDARHEASGARSRRGCLFIVSYFRFIRLVFLFRLLLVSLLFFGLFLIVFLSDRSRSLFLFVVVV